MMGRKLYLLAMPLAIFLAVCQLIYFFKCKDDKHGWNALTELGVIVTIFAPTLIALLFTLLIHDLRRRAILQMAIFVIAVICYTLFVTW